MKRYSILIRAFSLFLILLCTSCEELIIDQENPFEAAASEQIPLITNLNETINGSSVEFNFVGNDFALEFSYQLEYNSNANISDLEYLVDKPYFEWSDWMTEKAVSFSDLDEGDYTFYLKSRFDLIEVNVPSSLSFQIDNIAGPALRVYPLIQTANSGDEIDVYLYFEEVNAMNSINLVQVDLQFSGPSGSNAVVELNGEVENLSSSLYCSTANDNPLVLLIADDEANEYRGFNLSIIQSYEDDNGMGLCNSGPLVRIPLKVLAADNWISIEILNGQFQYYRSETDDFQEIEFNYYNGSVIVEDTVQ